MGSRSDLNTLLSCILTANGAAGSNTAGNVYYQPPETIKMAYPCIVYSKSGVRSLYAGGGKYRTMIRYTVTVIDPNPDSAIFGRMLALPYCTFVRHFTKDNLNHEVFDLYY